MSELKAYTSVDIEEMDNAKVYSNGKLDCTRVYLKSEADKIIAEKDTEIANLKACMADMVNTSNMVNDSAMRRERKLKRALWSMGAMLGKMGSLAYWNIKAKLSTMSDTEGVDWATRKHVQWTNVERKCRQRADWFK